MSKKIYIHVGMQKTGSTWLQSEYFPKITTHDVIYKESFRNIFYGLTDKDLLITYENYVGYPHILKSEDRNGWMDTRSKAIRNLAAFFPKADIILVIRKQSSLIGSLYNQYIKVGGNITLKDYWKGDDKYSLEREALLYNDLIKDLKRHFKGRVLVLDFDLFIHDKNKFSTILSDFLGGVNSFDCKDSFSKKVNSSLRWKDINALLFLYKFVGNGHNPKVRFKLNNRSFKVARWFAIHMLSYFFPNTSSFSVELKSAMSVFYEADWQSVSDKMQDGYFILSENDN